MEFVIFAVALLFAGGLIFEMTRLFLVRSNRQIDAGRHCQRCGDLMVSADADPCYRCRIVLKAEKDSADKPKTLLIDEAQAARDLQFKEAPRSEFKPLTIRIRDLHFDREVDAMTSTPCWELHHGPVTETQRSHPGDSELHRLMLEGWPAVLGDLNRRPDVFGYATGEPIRFWAPVPVPVGGAQRAKINLFEVVR